MSDKKPIPLVNPDAPETVIAYACGECRLVVGSPKEHGDAAESIAKDHCGPWFCKKCRAEHERRYQPTCRDCFNSGMAKRNAEREAKSFEEAKHVPAASYNGPVFWEDGTGHCDGFFASLEELLDWCACEDLKPPEYVWSCRAIYPSLRFDDLCEQALDDHHEGCELDAEDDLREFLDRWNAKQTGESWEPNYSHALILEERQ